MCVCVCVCVCSDQREDWTRHLVSLLASCSMPFNSLPNLLAPVLTGPLFHWRGPLLPVNRVVEWPAILVPWRAPAITQSSQQDSMAVRRGNMVVTSQLTTAPFLHVKHDTQSTLHALTENVCHLEDWTSAPRISAFVSREISHCSVMGMSPVPTATI